jgi:hypothetical protein
MAAGLGFEPRPAEPESVVLPLHYPATSLTEVIIALIIVLCQPLFFVLQPGLLAIHFQKKNLKNIVNLYTNSDIMFMYCTT